jgi:hypothetical protein
MLYPPSVGDLPAIFDVLKTTTPQRKVTYRLLRPDFLVVSGEIGRSIFYTRIAKPADQAGPLRGYTLTYPGGAKALDNISIAVANGWVPFPPAGGAPATSSPGNVPAGGPPRVAGGPVPPAAPALAATGVAVAPDKVLTLYGRCNEPRIAGRPATVLKRDEESGATVLQVAGLNARPLSLHTGSATVGHAALAVFLTRKATGTDVDAVVAPGEILSPAGTSQRKRLLAPIQAEGQGGPVFDRSGAFVGVAGRTEAPRQVAGIVPQRAWPLVEAVGLASVLAAGGIALPAEPVGSGAERGAAELAASVRQSLLPVFCAP